MLFYSLVIKVKIDEIDKLDRPREKMVIKGPEALSEVELLAIMLGSGSKNESVLDLSKRLIKDYGIDRLFRMNYDELKRISGIKIAKATKLMATFEITRRILSSKTNDIVLNDAKDVYKYVRGEYIARMDDDDISHPNRLEEEVKFLAEHPEYAIVATGYRLMDEKGFWGRNDSYGERTALDIFRGRYFAHPTVMIRKEAYTAVGGYSTDSKIGRMEDVDLWCKMYSNGFKGYVMDAILYDYFESRNSMQRRKYKHRITEFKLKMKYRKEMGIPFAYSFLAAKTLLVGLLPPSIIKRIHSIQYR